MNRSRKSLNIANYIAMTPSFVNWKGQNSPQQRWSWWLEKNQVCWFVLYVRETWTISSSSSSSTATNKQTNKETFIQIKLPWSCIFSISNVTCDFSYSLQCIDIEHVINIIYYVVIVVLKNRPMHLLQLMMPLQVSGHLNSMVSRMAFLTLHPTPPCI